MLTPFDLPPRLSTIQKEFLIIINNQSLYGTEIYKRINKLRELAGIQAFNKTSLYGVLNNMEENGLITVKYFGESNRKYYQITNLGSEIAAKYLKYMELLQNIN